MNARRSACTALLALAALTAGCSGHGGGSNAPSRYADGNYLVGTDIPTGTYTSAGAKGAGSCSIATLPNSEGRAAQAKAVSGDQPVTITLTDQDGRVTVHGCEPLTPSR